MTGVFDLDLCRYGEHCRTRTPGQPPRPGAADGRGLCPPDEANGRHVIGQLPHLWMRVCALVGKDAGRNGLSSMGGHGSAKVDPPTPLNLGMEALAQEISYRLATWAGPVWDRLPSVRARTNMARRDWTPAGASGLLVAHYQVLRSLTPTAYTPYDVAGDAHPAGSLEELDGPGAIVQLSRLYHKVKGIVGDDVRLERRDLPCPVPYKDPAGSGAVYGCGQEGTLVRKIGPDPTIFCTWCGWWCTEEEYHQYALTFRPPVLGRCPDPVCRAAPGQAHRACEVRLCLATGQPWGDCDLTHPGDCGVDVWTGIHPGVQEAREYGVDLTVLRRDGWWDPAAGRWYLNPTGPGVAV
jgi:hypothetical protein